MERKPISEASNRECSHSANGMNKPKLAFFQYKYDASLPQFLLHQKEEHVKCLSEFFDVTVINDDCDYQQICDAVRPDLTLVESGVSYISCQKLRVSNTQACPQIPKIGLMNSDAFCRTREGFVSDMDQWGIQTAFAIATTATEHNPHILQNLFVWPVFVDDEIYRDYGLWKSIPVLFTGNTTALYPWRQRMLEVLPKYHPCLISPHPGYAPLRKDTAAATRIMAGEKYARMLNSSQFVPACGTVAREVVRKHFEIPASKACLVTQQSAALEAAGFADMKNCVFADEHDVVDKLDYLFANPEELAAITEAGYQLVRSRHTLKQRNQIREWFDLQLGLSNGQRIVQRNPFEPMAVINGNQGGSGAVHIKSQGEHLRLLHEGDDRLRSGDYAAAQELYTRCMKYIDWMPEPQLRIAICQLYRGDAKAALNSLSMPLLFTLDLYRADDPDPEEWAYFVITLLCLGRLRQAASRAAQFGHLQHPSLDRVRAVVALLQLPAVDDSEAVTMNRPSIHNLPELTFGEWMRQLQAMLIACGQSKLAAKLNASVSDSRFEAARDNQALRNRTRQEATRQVRSVGFKGAAWKRDPLLLGPLQQRVFRKAASLSASMWRPFEQWQSRFAIKLRTWRRALAFPTSAAKS